jgi:GTPase SAR1 family protein
MYQMTDLEKLIELRREYLESLDNLAEHLRKRLQVITERLESSAKQSKSKTVLFETIWKTRLKACDDGLRQFARLCGLRPTICSMGKRGQGKTTLLQQWLGKSSDRGGIEEIHKLPTGDTDTTASLIRLTGVARGEKSLDPQFLYCEMLEATDLLQEMPDAPRPPAPRTQVVKLLRQVTDPDIAPEMARVAPYWVCRFPVKGTDDRLRLQSHNGQYVSIGFDGTEELTTIQWNARQVRIPISLDSSDNDSDAVHLLRVLDIIDAPGADSMAQDLYPEWKLQKNSYVFRDAVRELDVLLVVCSSDTAAIQLGGQFQKDIWYPWVDRCKGAGQGRLILAFSHAATFFEDADRDLAGSTETGLGPLNENRSFARKIWKNVLDGLTGATASAPPLVSQLDPTTWPPIFFFEKPGNALSRFSEGIEPGSAELVAAKLFDLMDSNPIPDNLTLTLGERCILRLVNDWDDLFSLSPDQVRVVKRWIISTLCSLLDPADRGYTGLTKFVIQYATSGPVAKNHAEERKREAEDVIQKFNAILSDLSQPAGCQEAIRELQGVQNCLRSLWSRFPRGPLLRVGENCRRRREDVEVNSNAITRNSRPFTADHVRQDVADDCLAQLACDDLKWSREQVVAILRAIVHCLRSDPAMKELERKHSQTLMATQHRLQQMQTVSLERVVRILDYLHCASPDQLKAVAQFCYQTKVEEAELIKPVLDVGLAKRLPEDEQRFASVQTKYRELVQAIEQIGFKSPYCPENAEIPEDSPAACKQ